VAVTTGERSCHDGLASQLRLLVAVSNANSLGASRMSFWSPLNDPTIQSPADAVGVR
jgi:hypothetical protein